MNRKNLKLRQIRHKWKQVNYELEINCGINEKSNEKFVNLESVY